MSLPIGNISAFPVRARVFASGLIMSHYCQCTVTGSSTLANCKYEKIFLLYSRQMIKTYKVAVNPWKCCCGINGSVECPNNIITAFAVCNQEVHVEMLFMLHGLNRTKTYYAKSPEPSAWEEDVLFVINLTILSFVVWYLELSPEVLLLLKWICCFPLWSHHCPCCG